jgi:flagellar assembly protein FliH
MGSSERVLSGRASRSPGETWSGKAATWRAPEAVPETPQDPMLDPAVQALIAGAAQSASERGYADGRALGQQEFGAAIASAQAVAHTLETVVPRDVEMVARTIAELSVLIARRILAAELRHDPAVLVAAIEAGLRQAAGASMITVELHPSAVDAVESAWTARHGARHRGFSWAFTADPTLAVGGCRLRTEHGFVEAGFEGQLAEVAAALDASIPGYLASALGPTAEETASPGAKATRRAGQDAAGGPALQPSTREAQVFMPAPALAADPAFAVLEPSSIPAAADPAADPTLDAALDAGADPAGFAPDELDLAALAAGGISPEDLALLGLTPGDLA